jgi:hypothetical protein
MRFAGIEGRCKRECGEVAGRPRYSRITPPLRKEDGRKAGDANARQVEEIAHRAYHRPVSALDEDTSIMRTRILATPLELRHAEQEPQSRARGIGVGVLLGALVWVAAIAVAVLLYRWATTWV